MNATPGVLHDASGLTVEWLSAALGLDWITGFESSSIGTGQMSDSHRVTLHGDRGADDPASVVVKFASSNEVSRATGVGLGAYDREVRFYRELAPILGGALPNCWLAEIDQQGWFTIVLEDVAPAEQGDQIAGCTVEQAEVALRELARLQAKVFADSQLGATPWLNQEMPLTQGILEQLLPAFLERYGDAIAPPHAELCERFIASFDGWVADRRPPLGLVHGDYRLDNMLFGGVGSARPFTPVDWQTVGWGPAVTDASYFIGGALPADLRREHEEALLRGYHEALVGFGVRGFEWETCWQEYRRLCFLGVLMVIAPAMLVERTERGDLMFMTLLERYAQQAIDLDSADLLPEPGTGRPAALRPEPEDEGRHAPGTEEMWNESWYFDAIADDCSFGLYTRLGLYPNQGRAWVTAMLCRPGRDTIALVDFDAPLPGGDGLAAGGGRFSIEHVIDEALGNVTVRLKGTGESHRDASALLRGEQGEPVEVELEATWSTDGTPYAYRVATRYEIPCTARGTVRIDGETIEFEGVAQRDHSWGTRDWWSAEWMWSAGRLEDGTRLHGVEFRIPDSPRIGLGYAQTPGGDVEESSGVTADETGLPNGLIERASIDFGLPGLKVDVEPVAFGPLRLVAPDGRVSEFPRAMCRLHAEDGRTGLGWVEWNRNSSLPHLSTNGESR